MLQKVRHAYEDDYSIYDHRQSASSGWRQFKGLYIVPARNRPARGKGKRHDLRHVDSKVRVCMVYAPQPRRERPDADQGHDRHGLHILQYKHLHEYGNVSVNTIRRDYGKATSADAKFDIADARKSTRRSITRPDLNSRDLRRGHGRRSDRHDVRHEPSSTRLEAEIVAGNEERQNFKTLAMTQVRMSIYFKGSEYDWRS